MAAKRRYSLPSEQMVVLAREARQYGISFDDWWEAAVRPELPPILVTKPEDWLPGAVVWPSDSADRNAWRIGTTNAKDGWRRAYENLPASRPEGALRLLEPLFGPLAGRAPASPPPAVAA